MPNRLLEIIKYVKKIFAHYIKSFFTRGEDIFSFIYWFGKLKFWGLLSVSFFILVFYIVSFLALLVSFDGTFNTFICKKFYLLLLLISWLFCFFRLKILLKLFVLVTLYLYWVNVLKLIDFLLINFWDLLWDNSLR